MAGSSAHIPKNMGEILKDASGGDTIHDFGSSGIPNFLNYIRSQSYVNGLPLNAGNPLVASSLLSEDNILSNIVEKGKFTSASFSANDTDLPKMDFSEFLSYFIIYEKCQQHLTGASKYEEYKNKTSAEKLDFKDTHLTIDNTGVKGEFTTINGNEYEINALVCTQGHGGHKINVDSVTFLNQLDINDKSIFIVDATAIPIFEILNTPGEVSKGKSIYYAVTPEVVNDPATKTSIYAPCFVNRDPVITSGTLDHEVERIKNEGRTALISCISNSPPDLKYNYYFDDDLTQETFVNNSNNYGKFFTRYNFELSELQPVTKGKTFDYLTNLKITYDPHKITEPTYGSGAESQSTKKIISKTMPKITEKPSAEEDSYDELLDNGKNLYYTEIVQNSKHNNDINFLSKILNYMLGTSNYTANSKEEFIINCKYQQKRAGDWLQVLISLFLLQRLFKILFPTGPALAMNNNADEFLQENVYSISHDRIYLAFELYCGGNIIYTNANTRTSYCFKLKKSILSTMNLEEKIIYIKTNVVNYNRQEDYISKNKSTLDVYLQEYKKRRKETIDEYRNKILDYEISFIDTALNFHVTLFVEAVREVFQNVLICNYLNLILPKLNRAINTIETNHKRLFTQRYIPTKAEYDSIKSILTTGAPPDDQQIQVIEKINYFIKRLNQIEKEYIKQFESVNKLNTMDFEFLIANFIKTPTFKQCSGWSWENNIAKGISSRILQLFTQASDKISDKNAFLYNLNIDNTIKSTILELFSRIMHYVKTPGMKFWETTLKKKDLQLVKKRLENFCNTCESFCAEVFINFQLDAKGLPDDDDDDEAKIITDSNAVLSQVNILQGHAEATTKDNLDLIFTNPNTSEITEYLIVSENQYANYSGIIPDSSLTFLSDGATISEVDYSPIGVSGATGEVESTLTSTASGREAKDEVESIAFETDEEGKAPDQPQELHDGVSMESKVMVGGKVDTRLTKHARNQTINKNRGTFNNLIDIDTNIKNTTYILLVSSLIYREISDNIFNEIYTFFMPETQVFNDAEHGPHEIATINAKAVRDFRAHGSDVIRHLTTGGALGNKLDLEKVQLLVDVSKLYGVDVDSKKEKITQELQEDKLRHHLFKNPNKYFHPMLPIYIILESLYQTASNDDLSKSFDYELFLNYFDFLKKMREQLIAVYESNNTIDLIFAFIIASGIKELLFDKNTYNLKMSEEGHFFCDEILQMNRSKYFPIALASDALSNRICGIILKTEKEERIGKISLQNPIFKEYMEMVNPSNIFNQAADISKPIEVFKKEVLDFLTETGEIIILENKRGYVTDNSLAAGKEEVTQYSPEAIEEIPEIEEYPLQKHLASDKNSFFATSSLRSNYPRVLTGRSQGVPTGRSQGGRNTHKHKKGKRYTRKREQKAKNRPTHFYRNKLKKYTRRNKPKKM